jgi:hypothetical protein
MRMKDRECDMEGGTKRDEAEKESRRQRVSMAY